MIQIRNVPNLTFYQMLPRLLLGDDMIELDRVTFAIPVMTGGMLYPGFHFPLFERAGGFLTQEKPVIRVLSVPPNQLLTYSVLVELNQMAEPFILPPRPPPGLPPRPGLPPNPTVHEIEFFRESWASIFGNLWDSPPRGRDPNATLAQVEIGIDPTTQETLCEPEINLRLGDYIIIHNITLGDQRHFFHFRQLEPYKGYLSGVIPATRYAQAKDPSIQLKVRDSLNTFSLSNDFINRIIDMVPHPELTFPPILINDENAAPFLLHPEEAWRREYALGQESDPTTYPARVPLPSLRDQFFPDPNIDYGLEIDVGEEYSEESGSEEEEEDTDLDELPDNVEEITISGGFSWSKDLRRFTNLKRLSLDGLGAGFIFPDELFELTSLEYLSVTGNSIIAMPAEIGKFRNLEVLRWSNHTVELPDELFGLPELRTLNLMNNHMSHLPSQIGKLQNLLELILDFNPSLQDLPPEIGSLQIISLSLMGCGFEWFPMPICNLGQLISLNISNNPIRVIPPEIANLRMLTRLMAAACQLEVLPPEIGMLKYLFKLDLSQNPLTILPPEIGQLRDLRTLDLSNTRLSTLPPEIGMMSSLEKLVLAFSFELESLPVEIGRLGELSLLSCSYCVKLRSLPPTIGTLRSLEQLNLNSCESLRELPVELSFLRNLIRLDLENTPIDHVAPVIVQSLPNLVVNIRKTPLGEQWVTWENYSAHILGSLQSSFPDPY